MTVCLEKAVEWVNVVADDGIGEAVIKTVTKEEATRNRELTWTSQAAVSVDGYELVTLRGNGSKSYAGQWEIGLTETVRAGETREEAVRRGLEEEIRIRRETQGRATHLIDVHHRNPNDKGDRKNVAVHRYFHNGPICCNLDEIAAALLLPQGAISWAIATQTMKFTPMNVSVHDKLVEAGVYR